MGAAGDHALSLPLPPSLLLIPLWLASLWKSSCGLHYAELEQHDAADPGASLMCPKSHFLWEIPTSADTRHTGLSRAVVNNLSGWVGSCLLGNVGTVFDMKDDQYNVFICCIDFNTFYWKSCELNAQSVKCTVSLPLCTRCVTAAAEILSSMKKSWAILLSGQMSSESSDPGHMGNQLKALKYWWSIRAAYNALWIYSVHHSHLFTTCTELQYDGSHVNTWCVLFCRLSS